MWGKVTKTFFIVISEYGVEYVIKDASLKRESVAGDKIDEVIKIWDI